MHSATKAKSSPVEAANVCAVIMTSDFLTFVHQHCCLQDHAPCAIFVEFSLPLARHGDGLSW